MASNRWGQVEEGEVQALALGTGGGGGPSVTACGGGGNAVRGHGHGGPTSAMGCSLMSQAAPMPCTTKHRWSTWGRGDGWLGR